MSDTGSGVGSSETTRDEQPPTTKDSPDAVTSSETAPCVDSGSTEEPLVRHDSLSYEDGNIIIVAENTMFQVHRSVLARKSALFKDLLSLPQPDTEEKIDNLPVVRLLDSSIDVALLIDSIYNGEKYVV